ncbi:MAG: Holliday junction resolvase RuvX [Ilumatobacteraceae bacterium]
MRVLGIDLGAKRIGVAVSDSSGTVATPLVVIARSRSRRTDHEAIARLVREEEAVAVVVGLPLNMDGSRGPAARAAASEAEALGTVVGVPVHLHDERLTTVTAERALREGGVRGRDRRSVVDKIAAAVLLQGWLDARAGRDE